MKSILKKSALVGLVMALVIAMMTGCGTKKEEQSDKAKEEVKVEANFEDSDYFVSSAWLNKNIDEEGLVVIDARGEKAYAKVHIKNSVPVQWQFFSKMDLKPGQEGFGVLLEKEELEKKIASLGIKADSKVVVYAAGKDGWGDDGRIVWMLKSAGVKNAKMLNDSFELWTGKGFESSTAEAPSLSDSGFKIEDMDMSTSIGTKELMENYDSFVIIDTRAKDEFDGEVKYGEARGGHLPGAVLLQYTDLFNEDKTLKSNADIEAMMESLGIKREDKIVTYCTAGIRSAYMQLALEMVGYEDVRNYDASFYEWAGNKDAKLGRAVDSNIYKYYTADQLQASIGSESPVHIVDIQVADEFANHHIATAIETNAYPVKSDEDKAKLDKVVSELSNDQSDIVIICPRGAGGATRTYEYLKSKDMDEKRLFILENGQEGWPFDIETK